MQEHNILIVFSNKMYYARIDSQLYDTLCNVHKKNYNQSDLIKIMKLLESIPEVKSNRFTTFDPTEIFIFE